VNSMHLTGGRVDASPERLRPCIDGGTGARTVRATQAYQFGCIPTLGRYNLAAVRNVV